jgi:hypothetical protein
MLSFPSVLFSPASPTIQPLDDCPLDHNPLPETGVQKAQLNTTELTALAPTACGALSLVNEGYFGSEKTLRELAIRKAGAVAVAGLVCLNPDVRTAIVKVIRAAVSEGALNLTHPKELLQETIATIFKNGHDHGYLNELMTLIGTECEQFHAVIGQVCCDLDLEGALRKKSVAFFCKDRNVTMKSLPVKVDEAFMATPVIERANIDACVDKTAEVEVQS